MIFRMRLCILSYLLINAFLLSSLSLQGQRYTVEEVPNPKAGLERSYVSNPDGILAPSAVDSLNGWLERLERKATAQVAVVVVADIASSSTRDFGQALFEQWGIGQSDKNNGLLILLVRDKRKINFITGYALEGVLTDLTCKSIQEEYMLPAFKKGEYDRGVLLGVLAAISILEDPAIRHEVLSEESFSAGLSWADLPMGVQVAVIALGIYGLIFLLVWGISHFRARPFKCYKNLAPFLHPALWIPFTLGPLAMFFFSFDAMMTQLLLLAAAPVAIALLSLGLRYYYRRAPRKGPQTGLPMHRLSEEAEDAFLSEGQQVEDRLKSKHHDVWVTANKEEFLVLSYDGINRYQICPQCEAKTYERVFRRTLIAPTVARAGRGQEKYACVNCQHQAIRIYPIAKLIEVEPRNSYSSSRSYGSSGSSSYSSSSSSRSYSSGSSGSSSWGGGSSGGGGAESSW